MLGKDGSGDPPVSKLFIFLAFGPYGDRGRVPWNQSGAGGRLWGAGPSRFLGDLSEGDWKHFDSGEAAML